MSDFSEVMTTLTSAVCRGDGAAAAACFTEDGVYTDVFYGAFQGHAAIIDMIENHFFRDGKDIRWDTFDPVCDGSIGYARYVFSTTVKATGKRSIFEGVAIVRLQDGKISAFDEVANVAPGLSMSGASEATLARFAARQAKTLRARDEVAEHL